MSHRSEISNLSIYFHLHKSEDENYICFAYVLINACQTEANDEVDIKV